MQKLGLIILTAIALPFFAWASGNIIKHGNSIARLDEREKTTRMLVQEVRDDVKYIRKYLTE